MPWSWQDAERLAVDHLRQLGFSDARLTRRGADAGADVIGTGVVAQVKHWARPVGAPPIRDLHGTATAQRAIGVFYAAAGYTPQAVQWAIGAGVALFVYGSGAVTPLSPAAWRLVDSGAGPRARPAGMFRQTRIDTNQAHLERVLRSLDKATEQAKRRSVPGRPRQQARAAIALRDLNRVRRLLNEAQTMDPGDRAWRRLLTTVERSIRESRRLL